MPLHSPLARTSHCENGSKRDHPAEVSSLKSNHLIVRPLPFSLSTKDFWQQIGWITLAFAPVTVLAYMGNTLFSTAGFVMFLLKAAVYSLFHGAAIWVLAMKDEEKKKFTEVWQAVSRRKK